MKQLLAVLLLSLICSTAYSQNIDKIKEQDILILYFDSTSPKDKYMKNEENDKISVFYSYPLHSGKNKLDILEVCYKTYMSFYKESVGEKTFQMRINKSFLRKNKDVIITREFMEVLGYEKAATLLRTADRILLIDNADTKDNKSILLRQVRLLGEIII